MSLEICCQCEGPTGRAGRGEDSLYTDNDWGPYCEDCWGDADYWRCLADEKVSEIERAGDFTEKALRNLRAYVELMTVRSRLFCPGINFRGISRYRMVGSEPAPLDQPKPED